MLSAVDVHSGFNNIEELGLQRPLMVLHEIGTVHHPRRPRHPDMPIRPSQCARLAAAGLAEQQRDRTLSQPCKRLDNTAAGLVNLAEKRTVELPRRLRFRNEPFEICHHDRT
ncbi:hypothetical protein GCM10010170_104660 [Dactylosporangium salmoneum]|uniref:Uncharacterized protein n=1 Tax=Dactylosporangium salmoneum TaxID=53361 RepID=A0ABP5V1D3_9ACTN